MCRKPLVITKIIAGCDCTDEQPTRACTDIHHYATSSRWGTKLTLVQHIWNHFNHVADALHALSKADLRAMSECLQLQKARFNPKTSILIQKCHPYTRNLNPETSGDKTRFYIAEIFEWFTLIPVPSMLKQLLTLCWAATGSLPVDFTVYGNIFLRPAASTAVPSGRQRRQLLQSAAEAPAPGQHLDMC